MSLENVSIVPLKDVVKRVKVGFVGSCNNDYCSSDEGVPMIRTTNLTTEGIKLENLKYINNTFHIAHKKSQLHFGDILIARHGHNGLASLWEYKFDAQCLNVVVVEPDESLANRYYLTYLINSPLIQKQIKSLTGGSVQFVVNTKDIADLLIPIPSLDKQKEIADFISLFNKKISVCKSINKNLEQLMKCIFEDWFVNFNYSNDISFKSSELGEIPSNWNVKKLRDVLIVLESGKRPKGGISNIDDGIPSIGAENILGLGKFNYSKNKLISHEFFSTLKKGVIQDKDVLLYKDGAQLGRKSLFMKGFPFDICCINEHVFRLQSNDEINQFYLYLWLDQEVMTNEIINLNSNSAQPGINQNDVKSLPILVPELKIISKFNKIISPMMNQIFDNALKINKLTNLRDTLLPKLMSGEIDVSKINCDLELKYNYMKYLFNQIHKQLSKSVV